MSHTFTMSLSQDILFARLDSFLERCSDLLEFTTIVLEFSKLERIHLGMCMCMCMMCACCVGHMRRSVMYVLAHVSYSCSTSGGTKGKQLTQAVRAVHANFDKAMEQFKHVPYDIMVRSDACMMAC